MQVFRKAVDDACSPSLLLLACADFLSEIPVQSESDALQFPIGAAKIAHITFPDESLFPVHFVEAYLEQPQNGLLVSLHVITALHLGHLGCSVFGFLTANAPW